MYKEELANAQKEIHRLRNTVKLPEEIPELFSKETTKTTKRKYTQVHRSIQKKTF